MTAPMSRTLPNSGLVYSTERNVAERNHGLNHGTERYLKIQACSLALLKLSL